MIRKQKKAMSRMFTSGKLQRGTVPPGPATVPQSSLDCKQKETSREACEGGAVPPSPAGGTSSPTQTRQRFKSETVPPNPVTVLTTS